MLCHLQPAVSTNLKPGLGGRLSSRGHRIRSRSCSRLRRRLRLRLRRCRSHTKEDSHTPGE